MNGPYSAIMSAFTPPDGTDGLWGFNIPGFSDQNEGPMSTTLPSTAALAQALAQPAPQQKPWGDGRRIWIDYMVNHNDTTFFT